MLPKICVLLPESKHQTSARAQAGWGGSTFTVPLADSCSGHLSTWSWEDLPQDVLQGPAPDLAFPQGPYLLGANFLPSLPGRVHPHCPLSKGRAPSVECGDLGQLGKGFPGATSPAPLADCTGIQDLLPTHAVGPVRHRGPNVHQQGRLAPQGSILAF